MRRGGKEGPSADRRLVICKKFISTFKKEREPEGPGCLRTEAGGRGWGSGWVGKPPRPLPAPSGSGRGTGHRLTDSRTRSRAHGSRINNFIYTLRTVCTALRRPGRSEWGSPHCPPRVRGAGEGLGVQLEHGGGGGASARSQVGQRGAEEGRREQGCDVCTSAGGSGPQMEWPGERTPATVREARPGVWASVDLAFGPSGDTG